MTVKHADRGAPAPSTAEYVAEFASLLGDVIRDLKHVAPPPPRLAQAVEQAGLGNRHRSALMAVTVSGPQSVSDLAARLGLMLSTTSTIVGELSRAGLVERIEDDSDRRRTIVHLHGDYRGEIEDWLRSATTPIRETFEQLSPEARVQLMDAWRLLHEHTERAVAAQPAAGEH
jgi:DNA-binding MarR family transcriptional regulator